MFTIVTGAQFGDEGKGKIVDLLAEHYDYVVRFQGGNNAGHTVKVGDLTIKLHIIPSGVLSGAKLLIEPGVVLDPLILEQELKGLREMGIVIGEDRLGVDLKTSVIMPYHIKLDELAEHMRKHRIGTTKRGIGYAYMDKVARDEITVADIISRERFDEKIREIIPRKETLLRGMGADDDDIEQAFNFDEVLRAGNELKTFVTDVSLQVNMALREERSVLAEGAQGTHLDVLHGTQKYVTSSSTIAGSSCASLGVGPRLVDEVLGVVKAYITRVGEGPLPTELNTKEGEHLQKMGGEFGTTTGRPRRCGWFDVPLVRKSIWLNGYTSLALTKLDVLTGLDPILICTAYELDDKRIDYPPTLTSDLARCKPIYEVFPGWDEELYTFDDYSELPEEARKYVSVLENLLKVSFSMVSVGPERNMTFFIH